MTTARPLKRELAGTVMAGADRIIQVMVDEGVDTIFGYSGGAILPTYDAIFCWNKTHADQPIRLIVSANEQGAGFMASGYARATGKVGVTVVTSGPGATNCTTPVRDCMADSIPIVVICGQVARPSIGTDAFQEAPVLSLMSSCAKHVFLVEEEDELEESIRTAFYIARSGRPGPVVIDLPKDVQNAQGVFKGEGLLPLQGYERMATACQRRMSKEKAAEFFGLLKKAKRPLVYAGGGIIIGDATGPFRKFVKRYQLPVVTTLMGIGAIDTTDELALHMLGMHGTAYANYAVLDCDLLIAIGARFDDRVAGVPEAFAENAKIAHIDIDAAEIGKVKAADWSHVADAGVALEELMVYGEGVTPNHTPWLERVKALKKTHKMDYDRENEIIQPPMVIETLNGLLTGDAIICTGVGQHQMFSAQYFDFKEPRRWLTSGSMGTMGFGLPAAIGAQVGRPDLLVVDVDGDGSLRMNQGELETCTNYNIPVKVLLLNNRSDGMVFQWQTLYFDKRYSGTDKSSHKKDFVKTAEADGFQFARRVTEKSELEEALKALLEFEGPALLEVMVDQHALVYPMVGPGETYHEMLTGPHIPSRDVEPEEREVRPTDSF